jgi:hypothetical protein
MSSSKGDTYTGEFLAYAFGAFVLFMIGGCINSSIQEGKRDTARRAMAPKAHEWIAKNCQSQRMMDDGVTPIYRCGNKEYRYASILNIFLEKDMRIGHSNESNYR